jgi:hypothetical protein
MINHFYSSVNSNLDPVNATTRAMLDPAEAEFDSANSFYNDFNPDPEVRKIVAVLIDDVSEVPIDDPDSRNQTFSVCPVSSSSTSVKFLTVARFRLLMPSAMPSPQNCRKMVEPTVPST